MKKYLTVFLLFALVSPLLHAQQDLFKSLFIYNFTKNIEWPSEYKHGDFVISVVGQDGIVKELQKLAETKKVGTQGIVVKQVNSVSEVSKSHIVFVSSAKSSSLTSVVDQFKGSPSLIISDQKGGCRTGSGINFALVDGKIKFEIFPKHITDSGLLLSPKLATLGIVVE